MFDTINSLVGIILLCISSIWVIVVFLIPAVKASAAYNPIRYFMRFNYYVLFVILVLNFDHFFIRHLI